MDEEKRIPDSENIEEEMNVLTEDAIPPEISEDAETASEVPGVPEFEEENEAGTEPVFPENINEEPENEISKETLPLPDEEKERAEIPSFGQNPDFGAPKASVFEEFKSETEDQYRPEGIPENTPPAMSPMPIRNPSLTPAGIPNPAPKKKTKNNPAVLCLSILVTVLGVALVVVSLFLAAKTPIPTDHPQDNWTETQPPKLPNGEDEDPSDGENKEPPQIPEDNEGPDLSPNKPGQTTLSAADVIEKCEKSVVVINASGYDAALSGESMGSGVILSENGYILTNAHVIAGATTVKVKLFDGVIFSAEVIGSDSVSDIAVLKIEAEGLPAAEIGDSSLLRKGDPVIAIGHPYSEEFAYTSTMGIVSNLHEDFHFEELGIIIDLIQHDATINMGNSGGPLVNMYGQVVGINSVKISGDSYENIGFAIQINSALEIAGDLIEQGAVNRPIIGIQCQTDYTVGGALVIVVAKDGPAEKAGLLEGDIITGLNGERLYTTEEFIHRLSRYQAGDTVTLSVLRNTEPFECEVILAGNGSVTYGEDAE